MIVKNNPTFLVVDDDPMVRKIVARGLADLKPAEVLEVEDGVAAQAVLRTKHVDVVVTDVLMPNMSGLELMKWAQEHCPEPAWIVLSGLETFDAAVDALQLGAFDYLAKPPEVQRVRVAVRNALDQIELVRERKQLYEQLEHSNAQLEHTNAQLAEKVDQLQKACGILEEQASVIQSDLDRAEIIQRALLPQAPPDMDGWCVETLYRSGSSVGGDFYDVISLDKHHLGLVIADAAGHGVAAAMLSVLFKLRLNLIDKDDNLLHPAQVLEKLNRALHATVSAPGAFITAAYVLLNHRTGQATLASAGHPPCIWSKPDGSSGMLERTGPALGLAAEAHYTERVIHLDVGDRLMLYTDGVLGTAESASVDDITCTLCSSIDRTKVPGTLYRAATQDVCGDRDDITVILMERGEGVSHYDDTPSPNERQEGHGHLESQEASTAQSQSEPQPQPKVQPQAQPQLLGGVSGECAFISISGTATWTCSHTFLDAAQALLDEYGQLIIDLGDCDYLDSTCLGTLHEVVNTKPAAVRLQRLPDNIRAQFEELSMEIVLKHTNADFLPLPQQMTALRHRDVDDAQQGARMLSAHETLASLSPQNREVFRGVVDALRADLGR